jgi:hypothetical protein
MPLAPKMRIRVHGRLRSTWLTGQREPRATSGKWSGRRNTDHRTKSDEHAPAKEAALNQIPSASAAAVERLINLRQNP